MGKAKIYGMKRKCIPNKRADEIHGKAMARGWAKNRPPILGRGCAKPTIRMEQMLKHMEESNA